MCFALRRLVGDSSLLEKIVSPTLRRLLPQETTAIVLDLAECLRPDPSTTPMIVSSLVAQGRVGYAGEVAAEGAGETDCQR